MRTFLLLFFTTAFGFTPGNTFSQNAWIKIKADKTVSVNQMFDLVQQQSGVKFIYNDDLIANAPRIELKKGVISAKELIQKGLSPIGCTFEFFNDELIIVKRDLKSESIEQVPVTGTVTDENGKPLVGANILEKGTKNSATTDIDGKFTIDVDNPNAILVVSYVGLDSQEISLNNQTSVAIKLVGKGNFLNEIIITGTGKKGVTLLNTSYAASVMTAKDIQRESAGMGIIDMLKGVPGLYGQSSGGEVGSTLSPRGLSTGFFSFISLQEDGLPVQYDGTYNEMQVRNDLTYDRVEIVRGGPSGVLAANGAGAIVNFTSRMPEGEPSGKIRLSVTDYGSKKTEFVYGGQIADKWQMSIGGYYRVGDGIKSSEFIAERGGQLRASVKRQLENGAITFSYKHINDRTPLFVPAPVKLDADGDLSVIPGFNSQTQTLSGLETQHAVIKDGAGWSRDPGGDVTFDLSQGIHTMSDQASVKFEHNFGKYVTFTNHARFSTLSHTQADIRNAGPNNSIQKVSDHIADNQAKYLAAIGNGATAIELRRHSDGVKLDDNSNGNGLVLPIMQSYDDNTRNVFINDLNFKIKAGSHNITLGTLYFNTSMASRGAAQNMLGALKGNVNVVDIVGIDNTGKKVGQYNDKDGVLPGSNYVVVGSSQTKSASAIINDEIQVTRNLKIDAGIRFEKIDYLLDKVTFAASNTTQQKDFNGNAWTIGGNYTLGHNMAVYGRYARGIDFGIRTWDFWGTDISKIKLAELNFSEFGFRYNGNKFSSSVTAFRSVNKDVTSVVGNQGETITLDNVATGVELDGKFIVSNNFDITLGGVIMNSILTGGTGFQNDISGNRVTRTPNVQMRLIPTLYFANRKGSMNATFHYLGDSYGDLENTLRFPGYLLMGAGVNYKVYDNITLSVQGTNITNAFGFTEGNGRGNAFTANDAPYIYARPVLPAAYLFSVVFDF